MKRAGWRCCSSVCFALLFMATIATATGEDLGPTLTQLQSGDRPLLVGGVADFSPFNVVKTDGQLAGMDRDIMRALAAHLDIKKIEFRTMWFGQLEQALLEGKIDVIACNFWITPERQQRYGFTMPYYVRGGVGALYLDRTGPYEKMTDLAGKRIAVFKGSYGEIWVRENVPTAAIVAIEGSSTDLDNTLVSKQADVVVGFYTRQKEVSLQEKEVLHKVSLLQPMKAAFAVRKQSEELRVAMDRVLKTMWEDGSLNKIKEVYLRPLDIEPVSHP